jgi:hypothetical protein
VSGINNTTSRSELVDRCVRIELAAARALTGDAYNTGEPDTDVQDLARDIIAVLRGRELSQ